MKKLKKIKSILLGCFLLTGVATNLSAQQAPLTSGGEFKGAGGTVSYSIGQTDYITINSGQRIITEGLQQPYEIFAETGIEQINIKLICTLYPNPTTDFVILSVENMETQYMGYELFDIKGELLAKHNLSDNKTIIQMEGLSCATYFIKIFNNNKEVKLFKIIKNQ